MADSVLRSFKLLAAARFALQVVTWIVTLVVIRLLSPEDYGLMAIAGVFLGFFALINDVGLSAALVQRQKTDPALEARIFGAMILLNGALYGVVFLGAPLAALAFDEVALIDVLRFAALQLLLNPLITLPDAKLRRAMNFGAKSRIEFVAGLAGAVATLGLALGGYGVWALVYGSLILAGVRALMGVLAVKGVPWPSFDMKGVGAALGFGSYVTADRLAWFLFSQADIMIAGRLLGKEAVGLYAVAMQIAALPMQKLSGLMNDVGFAAFARLQTDLVQLRAQTVQATRLVAFFAFPVFFGISAVAPEAVSVLLGEKWAGAEILIAAMCLIFPLRMAATVLSNALLGVGAARLTAMFGLVGLLIMPMAFYVGAQQGGIYGVALAWPLAYPLHFAIVAIVACRHLQLPLFDYLKTLATPCLFGGLMFGVVTVLRPLIYQNIEALGLPMNATWLTADLYALVILAASGGALYGGLVWFFARDVVTRGLQILRS